MIQLCSINDAAGQLGIGRTSLYKLIKEGRLELVKLGSRSLIKASSIDALIAECGVAR